MERVLDLDRWKRRDHYEFYKDFDLPFFNVCAEMDVTQLVRAVRDLGHSYFFASLYLATRACNDIEELRLRIRDGAVILHDVVHPGSTVLNEDETFGFCYFNYVPTYSDFATSACATMARYHASRDRLRPEAGRDNLIYYSVLPWIAFTSFAHARSLQRRESIPRIVFGKYRESGAAASMPVSVEVHHALVDGIHVGRFYHRFQELLNRSSEVLMDGVKV